MDEEPDYQRLIAQADGAYQPFPDFSTFVEELLPYDAWQRDLALLETTRAAATDESLRKAVNFALRAAAVDTGAIEDLYTTDQGFTLSVAAEVIAWETALAEKGEEFGRLFEAQLAAYELVLDAATGNTPISEAWLRHLHEVVCSAQDSYRVLTAVGIQEQSLPKGEYKILPNHVRLADGAIHSYAPVVDTSIEVRRLVEQLTTPAFEAAHAVDQAAYAHYALVVVHPFADGNGRVARALASLYTLRAASVPLLIFADQKAHYLDALRGADAAKYALFRSFVYARSVGTLRLVRDNLAASRSAPDLAPLARTYYGPLGIQHSELDALTNQLVGAFHERVAEYISSLTLPPQVAATMNHVRISGAAPSGYRRSVEGSSPAFTLQLRSAPPAAARAEATVVGMVTIAEDPLDTFLLADRTTETFEATVSLADVYPSVSGELDFRLQSLARRFVDAQVNRLAEDVRAVQDARGF